MLICRDRSICIVSLEIKRGTTTRYGVTFFLLAVPAQTEAAQYMVTRIAVFIL